MRFCPTCRVERADDEGCNADGRCPHLPTCPNCDSATCPVVDDAAEAAFRAAEAAAYARFMAAAAGRG